jgi:hypothetical protein
MLVEKQSSSRLKRKRFIGLEINGFKGESGFLCSFMLRVQRLDEFLLSFAN